MAKNTKAFSAASSSRMSRISSRDPQAASRYYHEVMREAIQIVKSSEAQRRSANRPPRAVSDPSAH